MKILIIHTAFIGDIALSTPLLKRIKEIYPDSKISYVTTSAGASLLRNNPYLSEIIEYDKRGMHAGIKGVLSLGRRLRYENFQIVICLHRYLRSSVLSWLTRSPKRVGYDVAGGSFLFTDKITYDKKKCEVERILSFMGKIPETPKEKYPVELYPSKKDILKVDKIWKDNNLKDKKVIVIAPGSKWFTKRWPVEYFNEVINFLCKKNEKISTDTNSTSNNLSEDRCINDILNENIGILIVGGEEEKNLKIDITDDVIDLRGETSLLELAEILKRSDIVLTNDSSPIHIASSSRKTHIIVIFGPTVKEFGFFPWSENSEVLEIKDLKCRPCSIHGGNSCPKGHFRCMMDIKPERVYDRIMKSLEKIEKEYRWKK